MLSGTGTDGPQLLQKSFPPPCKHSLREINNALIQLTISHVTDWAFQSHQVSSTLGRVHPKNYMSVYRWNIEAQQLPSTK